MALSLNNKNDIYLYRNDMYRIVICISLIIANEITSHNKNAKLSKTNNAFFWGDQKSFLCLIILKQKSQNEIKRVISKRMQHFAS